MKRLTIISSGVALTAAVVAALFVSGAFGGSDAAPPEDVARDVPAPADGQHGSIASEPAEDATGDGAAGEAIGVKGNWHVAIYNADGTLDEEHRFVNALKPQGGTALGRILSADEWAAEPGDPDGGWAVAFGERDIVDVMAGGIVPGVGPCSAEISDTDLDGTVAFLGPVAGRDPFLSTGCALWWPDISALFPLVSSGVLNPPEAITGGVRVSGSVDATQDGTINYVETWLTFIDPPEAGGTFPEFEVFAFTGTSVGPFEVQTGQTINMTVEITFTTAP